MTAAAQDLLRIPIARMISRWPLLGGIVGSWEIFSDTIPTIGIGVGRSGLRLYVNPAFVSSLTIEQVIAVLHHEVRHVIYGHIYQDPADFSDAQALMVAQEVTVNENLPGKLPGHPILLKQFPNLPADEDTLTRYQRLLMADGTNEQPPENGAGEATSSDQDAPKQSQTKDPQTGKERISQNFAADESTQGKQALQRPDEGGALSGSHDHWQEIIGQESLIRQQVEAIAHAVQAATSANGQHVSPDEVAILKKLLRPGVGKGNEFALIEGNGTATVNWRQQLRRWVGRVAAPTLSYQYPSRRLPQFLGIVPGKRFRQRRIRILVAIDTSGSVEQSQLENFCSEVCKLAYGNEVWVAETDYEVQRLYRYRGPPTCLAGRGGTSFLPVFEPSVIRRVRPDLVIYLTDGFGQAPDNPPPFPVLWVLVPDGEKPSTWGQALWLKDDSR